MKFTLIFIVSSLAVFFSSCAGKQKVSLVVHHAKIYTADEQFSTAEAMAVNNGKVIETGTNDYIQKNMKERNR
jgi:predicted amidohydrolase YtcJ